MKLSQPIERKETASHFLSHFRSKKQILTHPTEAREAAYLDNKSKIKVLFANRSKRSRLSQPIESREAAYPSQ